MKKNLFFLSLAMGLAAVATAQHPYVTTAKRVIEGTWRVAE